METAQDITKFITHHQYRWMDPVGGGTFEPDVSNFQPRIASILSKINSLLDLLDKSSHDYDTVAGIRDMIGTYTITRKKRREELETKIGTAPIWYKGFEPGVGKKPILPLSEINNHYQDWFGPKKHNNRLGRKTREIEDYVFGDWNSSEDITVRGGWVTISLSDAGIEYLNAVAKKITSYTTS